MLYIIFILSAYLSLQTNMDDKPAPKSAAQRMREYRQRMSSEKKDEAKLKNTVQQMSSRSKWTSARKKLEQERTRDRVRKHRQRCKAVEQQTPTKVFNSAQALGKAVSRVTRALPNSPRRKMAVVKRLVHHFGVDSTKPPTPTSIRNPAKVFNSAQALGKAVSRVTRALPNSPRRWQLLNVFSTISELIQLSLQLPHPFAIPESAKKLRIWSCHSLTVILC